VTRRRAPARGASGVPPDRDQEPKEFGENPRQCPSGRARFNVTWQESGSSGVSQATL